MEKFITYWPMLWQGTIITIKLCVVTLVFALPLGLPLALGSISRIKPIKWICDIYILIFRGTPLLLQLYFTFFILPLYGVTLDAFTSSSIAFILNYAAYLAEIYRGGINSVDKGQFEAAHALGVTRKQCMMDIILPQTFKAIIPPVANEAIILVKDTALASTVALMELMKASRSLVNTTTDPSPYLFAAVIYLVLTMLMTKGTKRLEKHFSRYDAKEEF